MEKILISFLDFLPRFWGYAEPIIWLGGALSAGVWWVRKQILTRRLRNLNQDDKFVVLVQVGRDVRKDVTAKVGAPDEVITVRGVLTSPADYRRVVRRVLKAVAGHREIHLVVAGPVALAFVLGQQLGTYKSRVLFYQYTAGAYQVLDTWKIF